MKLVKGNAVSSSNICFLAVSCIALPFFEFVSSIRLLHGMRWCMGHRMHSLAAKLRRSDSLPDSSNSSSAPWQPVRELRDSDWPVAMSKQRNRVYLLRVSVRSHILRNHIGLRGKVDWKEDSFEAGHRVHSFSLRLARSSPLCGVN